MVTSCALAARTLSKGRDNEGYLWCALRFVGGRAGRGCDIVEGRKITLYGATGDDFLAVDNSDRQADSAGRASGRGEPTYARGLLSNSLTLILTLFFAKKEGELPRSTQNRQECSKVPPRGQRGRTGAFANSTRSEGGEDVPRWKSGVVEAYLTKYLLGLNRCHGARCPRPQATKQERERSSALSTTN